MSSSDAKPTISLFFPVYRDENTIRTVTQRAVEVLEVVASDYEIVIVNDGSPDRCGELGEQLAAQYEKVSIVHHPRNLGYGRAIQTGFAHARRFEWVCFTDGDNQYDVGELFHLVRLLPRYDVVIGFRYRKVYGAIRILMSKALNLGVRLMYGCRFRDITCGLKIVRRAVVDDIDLICTSPFVGGELVVRAALKGYAVGEAGIATTKREFGDSAVISWKNIVATLDDMLRIRREVFHGANRPPREAQQRARVRPTRLESPPAVESNWVAEAREST